MKVKWYCNESMTCVIIVLWKILINSKTNAFERNLGGVFLLQKSKGGTNVFGYKQNIW